MAYEGKYGELDRFLQFAKYYIYSPSAALYTCPLAMTDGAARLIEVYGDKEMKDTLFKKIISRDPKEFITFGQWMARFNIVVPSLILRSLLNLYKLD